jgi:GH24 family phage-related lysozyme (muramidase)
VPILLEDDTIGWAALEYLEEVQEGSPQLEIPGKEKPEIATKEEMAAPGALKTSPRGLEFIKKEEGCILHVYDDPAGNPTIGVGHLIKKGEEFGEITEEEALKILARDLKIAEGAINEYVQVPLNQNQFDALVSFVFNVGAGAFQGSTLLRLLNQGHYGAVPEQLAQWRKAGGQVLAGLVKRREREGELWGKAAPLVAVKSLQPTQEIPDIPLLLLQNDLPRIFNSPSDRWLSPAWKTWGRKWVVWLDLSPWADHLRDVGALWSAGKCGFWGNKILQGPINKVFSLLAARGLLQEIETFDGCWNPRPMTSGERLSVHSWGLALDFNADANPYGGEVNFSDQFLQTWADCGWECGATWSTPDGMHVQWALTFNPEDYEPGPLLPTFEARS